MTLLLSTIASPAQAEMLTYSSGTGFFVDRNGMVLTNNHVIRDCKEFSISGAVPLTRAKLVARDEIYDLALLQTPINPGDLGRLSTEKQPMRPDDPVVVVGYPGQSWQTGETVTREARIIDTKGPSGEEKWLQFSDTVEEGNSGGPLLDQSGNVVGVVAAKARLYTINEVAAREETVRNFDVAISLPVLRRFLKDNGVRYQEADSGIYLSADRITNDAERFVVNVRCQVHR